MKLIADVMLGRLAKRLRLLGFDVLYGRQYDDDTIIGLSLEQDRMILTRDTNLASRPLAANHLLISSDQVADQVAQVLNALPAPSPGRWTRCSICNGLLVAIPKEEAKDLVPDQVYEMHNDFVHCRECGRNYWKGSHRKRMEGPA